MVQRTLTAIARTLSGIAAAVRAEKKIVWGVTGAVSVFNLAAPAIILSVVRKPIDFFTFNPWLPRLPEYLVSQDPLSKKLSFLSNMAIAWVSADNPQEGIDWGFIVDVPTLARILLTSLVFGAYFALWSYRRRQGEGCGLRFRAARPAGVAGAVQQTVGAVGYVEQAYALAHKFTDPLDRLLPFFEHRREQMPHVNHVFPWLVSDLRSRSFRALSQTCGVIEQRFRRANVN